MKSLRDQILQAAVLPYAKHLRKAKALAEAWADFSRLPEEEQEQAIEEYLEVALSEEIRLRPLLDKLACVAEAADVFTEQTQERSKVTGENQMKAPEEYVSMLQAIVRLREVLK